MVLETPRPDLMQVCFEAPAKARPGLAKARARRTGQVFAQFAAVSGQDDFVAGVPQQVPGRVTAADLVGLAMPGRHADDGVVLAAVLDRLSRRLQFRGQRQRVAAPNITGGGGVLAEELQKAQALRQARPAVIQAPRFQVLSPANVHEFFQRRGRGGRRGTATATTTATATATTTTATADERKCTQI